MKKIKPRCRHFYDCGGCSQQDIPYDFQVKKKKEILKSVSDDITPEFIKSPKKFGFRNKMEFSFEGENLGLHRRGKFDEVVDLKECPVFSDWIGVFLDAVRDFASRNNLSYYRRRKNSGFLRFLIVKESKFTGENAAVLVVNKKDFNHKEEWAETVDKYMPGKSSAIVAYRNSKGDSAFTSDYEVVGGAERMKVAIGKLELKIKPYSFFQPNSYQIQNIYSTIKDGVENKDKILDLYSGIGSIAFFLTGPGRLITTVENSISSTTDARFNLKKLNLAGKIKIIEKKVRTFLDTIRTPTDGNYGGIVLDPPRGGISYRVFKHIDRIASMGEEPVKIIYISCSIKNFKKDLKYIFDNTNWKFKRLTGIDQFVHTPHLESIAEFEA